MPEPRGFQYASPAHEADTARAGMWLFLASEVLFFGALLWVWTVLRVTHPEGVALAVGHTSLVYGSVNTAVLVSSSLVMTLGVLWARDGRHRAAAWAAVATAALGLLFLVLKGLEWRLDLHEGLFPGAGFRPEGADQGGARLFMSFYFVATGLHGLHMLVGIFLLAWLAALCWNRPTVGRRRTAVEVVGLYWSFVDTVWLVLYPLVYVVARP